MLGLGAECTRYVREWAWVQGLQGCTVGVGCRVNSESKVMDQGAWCTRYVREWAGVVGAQEMLGS